MNWKINPQIVCLRSAYNLRKYTRNSCSYNFIRSWRRVYQWGQYLQKNSSFIKLLNYQWDHQLTPNQSLFFSYCYFCDRLLMMMQNGVILQVNDKYSINFRITGSHCVDTWHWWTERVLWGIWKRGGCVIVCCVRDWNSGCSNAHAIGEVPEKSHVSQKHLTSIKTLNTIIVSRECPVYSSSIGSEQVTFLN